MSGHDDPIRELAMSGETADSLKRCSRAMHLLWQLNTHRPWDGSDPIPGTLSGAKDIAKRMGMARDGVWAMAATMAAQLREVQCPVFLGELRHDGCEPAIWVAPIHQIVAWGKGQMEHDLAPRAVACVKCHDPMGLGDLLRTIWLDAGLEADEAKSIVSTKQRTIKPPVGYNIVWKWK